MMKKHINPKDINHHLNNIKNDFDGQYLKNVISSIYQGIEYWKTLATPPNIEKIRAILAHYKRNDMDNNTNNTREFKIISAVNRPGYEFKPTDGKVWRSPMQVITTSDGVFIDNQPGVSLGWGSWVGHDWQSEVGNTVVAELSGTCGYTWIKFIQRADRVKQSGTNSAAQVGTNLEHQLAAILQAMYENAPEGYKVATLIHFGKTYRKWITLNDVNINTICKLAGDPDLSKLPNRVRDGIKLADID